jgi:hypothetical protein
MSQAARLTRSLMTYKWDHNRNLRLGSLQYSNSRPAGSYAMKQKEKRLKQRLLNTHNNQETEKKKNRRG